MRILFIFLLIITLMTLNACSLFGTKDISVSSVPVEKVPLILPTIDRYQGRDVEWIVVTPENYQEVLRDLKRNGSDALFALTAKGYENLSLNQSDILKIIKQQKEIIAAFKKYYQEDQTDQTDQTDQNSKIPEIE